MTMTCQHTAKTQNSLGILRSLKLHQGRFRLDIKNDFFTMKETWAWAAQGGGEISIPGDTFLMKHWIWLLIPWSN